MGLVQPLRTLLLAFAGWVSRHQAEVIVYLVEENRVLKEQMAGRALRLDDDQRRRLAPRPRCSIGRPSSASPRSSRPTP